MAWAPVAAAAAPIVGGLIGNAAAAKDRKQQKKMIKAALAELEKVGYPPDLSAELIYKEFEKVGVLTPQLEEDIGMAQTEYATLKEDPAIRETQLEALNKFKQQSQGGLAGDERAAMNEILMKQRQEQQAAQQNILANQQRTGMSRSGAGLIAQLQATQSAAGNAAGQGMDLMSLLAQRVRSGTQDMANTAQSVRGQDYTVASDKATAIDARNQYLNENSTSRQMRNVNSLNDAQRANLLNEQEISKANTQLYNAEQLRQRDAQQQYWESKLDYGTTKANANIGAASAAGKRAQQTSGMWSGLGEGVGQGFAAYGNYKNSQPAKTNNSGYGGEAKTGSYDDNYMNKVK